MTDLADRPARDTDDVIAELDEWLAANWDPDSTVEEWWHRLGTSGWAVPTWPTEWYGKGLTRGEGVAVQARIVEFGALSAPGGLGLLLAGPTIVDHGTDEQKRTYLEDIVCGRKGWCQLFSEPGAGSDLAGLQARAIKDGDEWIVNGQKVWTSGGHVADLGMLIARTDVDVPKHSGISYFAVDMHQEGMDVRPLKEMTGRALFNEVFMSDVRVPDAALIGGLNNGWRVANTTLMHERSGLGAGGGSAGASMATPGTVVGDLAKRVGDFVSGKVESRNAGAAAGRRGPRALIDLARSTGQNTDRRMRQDLARLYTLHEIGRMNNVRAKAAAKVGQPIPGLPNIAKLSMSEILRQGREIGLRLLGAQGTLHAYDGGGRRALLEATGRPEASAITESALFSPGPAIYGGTDQIQRNIIGERVLGLPKEPNQDKVLPFKDLPKNG